MRCSDDKPLLIAGVKFAPQKEGIVTKNLIGPGMFMLNLASTKSTSNMNGAPIIHHVALNPRFVLEQPIQCFRILTSI
jgi:hypothetical protein